MNCFAPFSDNVNLGLSESSEELACGSVARCAWRLWGGLRGQAGNPQYHSNGGFEETTLGGRNECFEIRGLRRFWQIRRDDRSDSPKPGDASEDEGRGAGQAKQRAELS
jgi:hypothetical protein